MYFFQFRICGTIQALAMVRLYSLPDPGYYSKSYGALIVCRRGNEQATRVIEATSIQSVVAMPKFPLLPSEVGVIPSPDELYYVVEKPGLDVFVPSGANEEAQTDEVGVQRD